MVGCKGVSHGSLKRTKKGLDIHLIVAEGPLKLRLSMRSAARGLATMTL